MKYIYLFIGLGLLLSGCEATDPKTPIRDYHANDTLFEVSPLNDLKIYYLKCDRTGSSKNSYSPIDTLVTVDERRKHISTEFTEGTYTEKDHIISAEHSHGFQSDAFIVNRERERLVVLQLDRITGSLLVKDNGFREKHKTTYQCKRIEAVVR